MHTNIREPVDLAATSLVAQTVERAPTTFSSLTAMRATVSSRRISEIAGGKELSYFVERPGTARVGVEEVLARRLGEHEEAATLLDEGRAVALVLVELDPGNARWRDDLSISMNNLGDLAFERRDAAGALLAYPASLEQARC
jgi:hypothetical protein